MIINKMNIDEILKKYKNVPFVKRILEQDNRKVDNIPSYGDYHQPSYSTHLLGYYTNNDGSATVIPSVQEIDDKLQRLDLPPYNTRAALDNALENGDYIDFNTEQEAADFTRNYKDSKAWKQFDNLLLVPKGQEGLKSSISSWFYNLIKPKNNTEIKQEPKKKLIPKYPDKSTKLNSTSSIHAERIKNDGRFDSRMDWDNMDIIANFFNQNMGYKTSIAIGSSIAPESFANPNQKQIGGGPGRGLIQAEKGTDRYDRIMNYPINIDTELNDSGDRQLNYILDATMNNIHQDDWHHGGKGSGYDTGEEARKIFINPNSTIGEKAVAFMLGFVRPKDRSLKARKEREYLAHSLDSIYNPRFYRENQ